MYRQLACSLALLVGCTAEVLQQIECEEHLDCASGQVCLDYSCRNVCARSQDCGGAMECQGGICVEAVCGNNIVGNLEECDVSNDACNGCQIAAGSVCNLESCSQTAYRLAMIDNGFGVVDVVDAAEDGIAAVVMSYNFGYNSESWWVDWSADGSQLAYPGGPPNGVGSVYLFDVLENISTRRNELHAYFGGDQPSFAPNRFEVLARQGGGYVTYRGSGDKTEGAVGSYNVHWPKWSPVGDQRFAFVHEPASGPSSLIVYDGSAEILMTAAGVSDFGWTRDTGKLYFLGGAGSLCKLQFATLSNMVVEGVATLAENVPCSARVVMSGDGARVAVAAGGAVYAWNATESVNLSERTPLGASSALILDIDWTPDGRYVGVLRNAGSSLAKVQLIRASDSQEVSLSVSGSYRSLRFSPDAF